MTTTVSKTMKLAAAAALALGTQIDDGKFYGITTLRTGHHVAMVLLDAKPGKRHRNQAEAIAWAEEVGGELFTRVGGALLYANAKSEFEPDYYFTCETLDADTGDEADASFAWLCYFNNGIQLYYNKSSAGASRAVRLIHLEI